MGLGYIVSCAVQRATLCAKPSLETAMLNLKSLLLILVLSLVSATATADESSMSIGSVIRVRPKAVISKPGLYLFTSPVNCTGLSITSWYACGFLDGSVGDVRTTAAAVEVGVFRQMESFENQFVAVQESITAIIHSPTNDSTDLLCNETSLPQPFLLLPTDYLAVLNKENCSNNKCPLRVIFDDFSSTSEGVLYITSTDWRVVVTPENSITIENAHINVVANVIAMQPSTTGPALTTNPTTTCAMQPSSSKVAVSTSPVVTSTVEPSVTSTVQPSVTNTASTNTQTIATIIFIVLGVLLSATVALVLTLVLFIFLYKRAKSSKAVVGNGTGYDRPQLTNIMYEGGVTHPLSAAASYTEPVDSIAGRQKNKGQSNSRQEFRNRAYSGSNVYSHPYEIPITQGSQMEAVGDIPDYEIDDGNFWEPASKEDELISQLSKLHVPLIKDQDLQVGEYLGSGQFGTVNKGVWHTSDEKEVAVKSLPAGSSEDERVKFLQEAAITGQFKHPSIVRLYAITTLPQLRIVLELLLKGDLRHYLKSLRPPPGSSAPPELPAILLSFCRQVAAGMSYLSNKGFIHRDLAARNILISQNCVCKIADFGLSRDLQYEEFYTSHGGKIPVKWTAPEAINYRQYSTASDVWSYGILLYEIWSLGEKPYSDCTNQEVIQKVNSGFRLAPPSGCPRSIYEIMISCWHPQASLRQSFMGIQTVLLQPDFQLLQLSSEHSPTGDERARSLGEPVETAKELYKDLQQTYTNMSL